ncbi:MAG: dihydroxyacetone kinase subunit DhaK, partial [Longicatena sp.]
MQRFVNDASQVVEDMLKGFVDAHEYIALSKSNPKVVYYKDEPQGKVGLVSGGGSGHEPAFLGYVGKHMLDAVAVGEVFSSP